MTHRGQRRFGLAQHNLLLKSCVVTKLDGRNCYQQTQLLPVLHTNLWAGQATGSLINAFSLPTHPDTD